jgi:putative N6-adenine-specific DNA methylase
MKLLVKTLHGLESILAKEIEALGGSNIKPGKRSVSCEGNLELIYKLNYQLRTGLKVLMPIHSFQARNEHQLYKQVKEYKWEDIFGAENTFAIDQTIFSEYFKHSKFAALRAKDAIVDRFREKYGRRPSVDTERPDFVINIHAFKDKFTISLDSTGEPLNQRGYRSKGHEAPLNEVLAAGIIQLSGWDKETALLDPMCGSGTILIEAAMLASNFPAQMLRRNFAFTNWREFQPALWSRVKTTANAASRKSPLYLIGNDIDGRAVKWTKDSFKKLGLKDMVRLKEGSFEELRKVHSGGMIITNPPYGERIGTNVLDLYKNLGDTLKNTFVGYDAWIFSSNLKALKQLQLKPSVKTSLYNGSLECHLCKYELYEGTKDLVN